MPDADWGQILLAHFSAHPQAQVTDLVKFAYQATFGGGHMIRDEAEALERIRTETDERMAEHPSCTAGSGSECALCEPVGNGLCRLDLVAAASRGMRPETVTRLFMASARDIRGSQEDYKHLLDLLVRFCREGLLPFPPSEMERFILDHMAKGCPAVGHSPVYREAYCPAYRIVRADFVELWAVTQAIDLRLEQIRLAGRPLLLSIEGPCGSGKSTMAAGLRELYGEGMEVIHMDDFFLPPELQTAERYAEPGGNIHYERFKTEVADALCKGGPFSYRVYDCQTRKYASSRVTVHPTELVVVEGVYGMHPAIGLPYDLRVFLSVSRMEQQRRVQRRSGPVLWKRFETEWIPMENKYFETFRIRERCDLVSGDPY